MDLFLSKQCLAGFLSSQLKNGGTSETVIDGKTGFLVDVEDLAEFSNKISILLSDPKLRDTMGANARHHAEKNFTWKRVAQELIDIYTVDKSVSNRSETYDFKP